MSIPGYLNHTNYYTCDVNGRVAVPVYCRGPGTYTLRLDHPITQGSCIVTNSNGNRADYTGGNKGQPYPNCFAWIVPHANWTGYGFLVSFVAGMPGSMVKVQLWLAPPGTYLPAQYGASQTYAPTQSSSLCCCTVM